MSFVVGTVTGLVFEFEFGTNFADFSTTAEELFGGPLAFERMMAFMLEATFTLLGFVTGYALLLGLYTYVVGRIIRTGPAAGDELESASESSSADPEVTTSD